MAIILQNTRCSVYRLEPGQCVDLTSAGGSLLLLSAGGRVSEETSSSVFQASPGQLVAKWEPFAGEIVRLRGLDGVVYATQVHGGRGSASAAPGDANAAATTNVGTELLIENALVRVWKFEVEAGAACHVHQHMRDYFFLNLVASRTQALDQRGKPKGSVSWQEAGQLTFVHVGPPYPVHGLVNAGPERFRQFVVEFKQPLSRL